jgi:hypothetical protein
MRGRPISHYSTAEASRFDHKKAGTYHKRVTTLAKGSRSEKERLASPWSSSAPTAKLGQEQEKMNSEKMAAIHALRGEKAWAGPHVSDQAA